MGGNDEKHACDGESRACDDRASSLGPQRGISAAANPTPRDHEKQKPEFCEFDAGRGVTANIDGSRRIEGLRRPRGPTDTV
jgi:hypothetical protein